MRPSVRLATNSSPQRGPVSPERRFLQENKTGSVARKLVLPDRIELFRCSLSSLKDQGFFKPLTLVVYQRKDHL